MSRETPLPSLGPAYTIEREIGSGGVGRVYSALDSKHGRRVAIKVLRPVVTAGMAVERFRREVSITATMQHPHVLTLIDSGETLPDADGMSTLFYVMPFVEGESLRDRLEHVGALPLPEAIRILRDVSDALAYAHRRGVVHRDVKPENILLADGHALVVDFGIAKAIAVSSGGVPGEKDPIKLTGLGVSLGTPIYMSPEQANGDLDVDERSDVYSVGILAYEMLAGAPPFAGPPQRVLANHLTLAPRPLQATNPTVPPALAAIVMRCLEKDRTKRFRSGEELLRAVEGLTAPVGGGQRAGRPSLIAETLGWLDKYFGPTKQ